MTSPSAAFARSRASAPTAFPESHAASFALAGLCLRLGQVPPPGGLRLRAFEQPAHGLLRAGTDRPRRPRARGRGASGGCQRQPLGRHPGAGRGRRLRPAFGLPSGQRAWPRRRPPSSPPRRGNGYPDPLVAPAPWRALAVATLGGAGPGRCLPLHGPRPPRGALGRQGPARQQRRLPLFAAQGRGGPGRRDGGDPAEALPRQPCGGGLRQPASLLEGPSDCLSCGQTSRPKVCCLPRSCLESEGRHAPEARRPGAWCASARAVPRA